MVSTCVFSPSPAEEVIPNTEAGAGNCSGNSTTRDKQKFRKRKRGCRAGKKTKDKKRRAIERIGQQNVDELTNIKVIEISSDVKDEVPQKFPTPPPVIEVIDTANCIEIYKKHHGLKVGPG